MGRGVDRPAANFSANNGTGTAQLTAGTDQQTLFAQNSPLSVAFGYSGAPSFQASVRPAPWFEIRLTCLDQCSTRGDVGIYVQVLRARFEVQDESPPTGGLVGTGTDAQTWSGSMRFG